MQTEKEIKSANAGGSKVSSLLDCYVAILDCCTGNGAVGEMWSETHICSGETTIDELMEWKNKNSCGYRLIITRAT